MGPETQRVCRHGRSLSSWFGCQECEDDRRRAERQQQIVELLGQSSPIALPVRQVACCPVCSGSGTITIAPDAE